MIGRRKMSDMITVTISFLSLIFYYVVSLLVVRSATYLNIIYLKFLIFAFLIIVPIIVILFVFTKSIYDLFSGQVTGYLRIKFIGITTIVYLLSIIIIADIHIRSGKIESHENVTIQGYREISEIIGGTLKLGGDKGIWNVSDLLNFINSVDGVRYSELTDRSGNVIIKHFKELEDLETVNNVTFGNEKLRILDSTGVRLNNNSTRGVIVDFEYRAESIQDDDFYYISIGFQPIGYIQKDMKKKPNTSDEMFNIFFYLLTLTTLYLFGIISIYYITKDYNRTVELLHESMEEAVKNNITEIKKFSEVRDVIGTVECFNRVLHEFELSKRNYGVRIKKQVWEEVFKRISHEIKNPLTPIRLSAERLLLKYGKENYEEILRKSVEVILNQVEAIEQKITYFSDFSDLPSLNMFLGNIIDLIENCLDKVFGSQLKKTVKLCTLIENSTIFADIYALEFVFSNILEISAKEAIVEEDLKIIIEDYIDDNSYCLISIQNAKSTLKFEKLISHYYDNKFDQYKYIMHAIQKVIDDHKGFLYCVTKNDDILLSVLLPKDIHQVSNN